MSKFTKTYSVLLAFMLISILTLGQTLSSEDGITSQSKQSQKLKKLAKKGAYVGPTDFDYTKLVSSDATKDVLHDNGPFVTAYGASQNGQEDYSELQNDLGMLVYGQGFSIPSGTSLCDDFEVTGNWELSTFTFYGFQQFLGLNYTFDEVKLQIWDGIPTDAGSSVIWGDIDGDNLFLSSEWTNSWRVDQVAPVEEIPIMEIVADVSGLTLTPGNYWVQYAVGGPDSDYSYAPPITILGETTTGNALQWVWTEWAEVYDVGPQGFPFIINGTTGSLPDNDLVLAEITAPNTGVELGMQDVTINILNAGGIAQSNFEVSFSINGGTPVTETVTETVASVEYYEYTFSTQADLTAYGPYEIEACVNLVGDENPDNDCNTKMLENLEPYLCVPEYVSGCGGGDGFSDFALEQIENYGTGCENNAGTGWSKYLELGPAELNAGTTYTISMTPGYGSNNATIWIDFNDDLVLTANEIIVENYALPAAGELAEVEFTLPLDANEGQHLMRARTNYNNPCADACEEYFWGEAEDYYVVVSGGLELCTPEYTTGCSLGDGFTDFALEQIENYGSGCENNAGTGWSQYFELGPAELTTGETYTITMTPGYSLNIATVWIDFNDDIVFTADEIIVENYALPDGGVPADVEFTLPEDAPVGQHYMRARTNYNADCLDACELYSFGEAEDYLIYVEAAITEYCDAITNTEDEFIANVLCGDINNDSGWQGGVADYTDQSTTILAGGSEDIVVTNGIPYPTDTVHAWVDWNDDFIFEIGGDEEFVLVNDGTGTTFTGAIVAPAGTPDGDYRMRIRMVYGATPEPCGVFNYGEVEDYTITVGASSTGLVFFDDFESGIDNWEVTGDWGITDEQSYSPSSSLTDSPGGDYLPNLETYATMTTGVDLSDPSILSADVDWWMIMDIENGNFDYLYVEVSTDDFATFTEIASFFGEGMLNPWMQYTYPLGAFLGNDNVKVRFHFSSDGGYEVDGCYVDDFSITTSDVDNAAPEIFFDAPFAYEGTAADYVVEAEIIDATGVTSAEVMYTVDGIAQANVVGVNTGGSDWEFTIPMQEAGYQVDFVIIATDSSPAANEATTDTSSYLAGEYIGYDNALVDFYTEIGPDGSAGLLGTAVVFTIEDPSRLVYALIRNYTDQSVGPNDEMVVHVWSDGGVGPGTDLIDPITIMPEANLVNTRAFTRIDLRDYEAELGSLEGDVYVGFTVPSGVVRTTITQPGIANRSFQSADGSTWLALPDDYHYRIVLGPEVENLTPAPTNLTAEQMDEDIVLNWVAPSDNSDDVKDFIGYNVYYGFDGASFDMIQEEITETTYTHTGMGLVLGLHSYYVTAVYDEGESLPSNEVEILITSIEDRLYNSTILYPNPASDVVNIKSAFKIKNITVYNYEGLIISKKQAQDFNYQFNTSHFNSGLYFFQIETVEGTINKRIIIQ